MSIASLIPNYYYIYCHENNINLRFCIYNMNILIKKQRIHANKACNIRNGSKKPHKIISVEVIFYPKKKVQI